MLTVKSRVFHDSGPKVIKVRTLFVHSDLLIIFIYFIKNTELCFVPETGDKKKIQT